MFRLKAALIIIVGLIACFSFSKPVDALKYELIPPDGQLQHGQQIQFVINIDTEGASLSSTQIGLTYQTQYLQYISVAAGNTMSSVTATTNGSGNLLFTGTNATAFSGQGVFATVTFQIIADAPGESELCVLYAPTVSPTSGVAPTQPVTQPTALPQTGTITQDLSIGTIGGVLLLISIVSLIAKNRPRVVTSTSRRSKYK